MSDRLADLRAAVRGYRSALLGYSGGVDSALLAVVLRQELGPERMVAAIGRSASYPAAQWAAARDVAARFDVPVVEVETQELDDQNYLANPTNRCFFCKTELWGRLTALAAARGFAVVCDGTNADDLHEHRPGYAAGARARVQYGLEITPRRLRQVEDGEAYLRRLGIRGDLRVRHRDQVARIEVEPAWIPWIEERIPEIERFLKGLGFGAVEVDPRGYRRGSLLQDRPAP